MFMIHFDYLGKLNMKIISLFLCENLQFSEQTRF